MIEAGELISSIGIYAATFVIALVGSLLPILSIEVFLIGLVVVAGPPGGPEAPLIVVLAATGQLLGKLPIYYASRGLTNLSARSPARAKRVECVRRWFAKLHPTMMLAASTVVGIPPFSIAATAAGILAIPVRTFCLVVLAGRATRFAAIFVFAG